MFIYFCCALRLRDTKKEELVKTEAAKLIVDEGLKGFSMQKLAKRCNISVATLYIYYKDQDDLITSIGVEAAKRFSEETLRDFSPEMSFSEGLKTQWKNRARYALNFRQEMQLYEILRHSPYSEIVLGTATSAFKDVMKAFIKRAIENKELVPVSIEVYWCVAFGPLYNLIKFHVEKKSIGDHDFQLTDEALESALQLVLKALKP